MKNPGMLVAALFLGSGLLLTSCKKAPVMGTAFLNFDPETSEGLLKHGFSGWEKTPDGDTFVWSHSKHAEIQVRSFVAADKLVRMRVWPFRYPGAPQQTATLTVNEMAMAPIPLPEKPAVVSVMVPASAWKEGENTLKLDFAYAEAPRDRIPTIDDPRTLSAAFDWIDITPARKPSGPAPKK